MAEMAACQSKTTSQLIQADISDRDVEETLSKHHYFPGKRTLPIIWHKLWDAV